VGDSQGGDSVVVLIPAIAADASADEQDALVQAEAVSGALVELGYRPVTLGVSLDLADVRRRLQAAQPSFVFNLVESLAGQGRLIHVVPALLDALGIAYTGCSAEAQFLSSNKLLAKRVMRSAGMPTPPWIEPGAAITVDPGAGPWIVKSVWEHASIGIDASAIVADAAAMDAAIAARVSRYGGDWFAEAYIDGREFNLALLAGRDGPMVLPPAEMHFVNFPAGKPRIVDYAAKWHPASFEFNNTVRGFDFPAGDTALLARISDLARACWHRFELTGYARVDFRIDGTGKPWVLEVNANPCISPDAGFTAAAARAGLSFAEVVKRICADRRGRRRPLTAGAEGPICSTSMATHPPTARN